MEPSPFRAPTPAHPPLLEVFFRRFSPCGVQNFYSNFSTTSRTRVIFKKLKNEIFFGEKRPNFAKRSFFVFAKLIRSYCRVAKAISKSGYFSCFAKGFLLLKSTVFGIWMNAWGRPKRANLSQGHLYWGPPYSFQARHTSLT